MTEKVEVAYPVDSKEFSKYVEVTPTSVKFTGQTGPIMEVGGINGCQIDEMIRFARKTLQVFNSRVSSRETALAITKLQEAELWLMLRTKDREKRGVEGTSKS